MRCRCTLLGLVVSLGLSLTLGASLTFAADTPKPWTPPKTKDGWAEKRIELRKAIENALGFPLSGDSARDWPPGAKPGEAYPSNAGGRTRGPVASDVIMLKGIDGRPFRVWFVRRAEATGREPVMIYFDDNRTPPSTLAVSLPKSLDGGVAPDEITYRRMATYWIECDGSVDPWVNPDRWPQIVANDKIALDYLLSRKDVDPTRIGVFGTGLGGTRALWLMALDDRIKVGAIVGGLTRFTDFIAKRTETKPVPPWMSKIMNGLDAEVLVALCAGRHFEASVGQRDPSTPFAGVDKVYSVGKAMANLLTGGQGFGVTYQNRQDEHYGRLQWIWALEIFDKAFFPQVSKPLGHTSEPEPEITNDFIDLAATGLAGWVNEMSQRPSTWTWNDGVITCKPGRDEYGWLRAPVEVGDFILSVEWRVPKGGNSGIFLRAKPVEWTFPPGPEYKRVVGKLALDWPSRTGLELQAQDDHGQSDKYTSGSLYRHAATAANPTHPAGQWNKFTVRARGTRVEVWSNGQQILDADLKDCDQTLAVPPLRGYIGLQNHGSAGDYRNVKLKRL